jgi:hypothetical protein
VSDTRRVPTSPHEPQAMWLLPAVAAAGRQVAGPALAVVGAVLVLAAEAGEVLIHGDTSVTSTTAQGAGFEPQAPWMPEAYGFQWS